MLVLLVGGATSSDSATAGREPWPKTAAWVIASVELSR